MSDDSQNNTDYDDVDDVIALAERLRSEDESELSAEEMADIGAELDIPQRYVDQARRQLEEQRERQQREAKRASKLRRKLAIGAAVALFVLATIFGLWSNSAVSSVSNLHAQVQSQRAQVENVRARQRAIEERLADRPDSPDKDAELVGAQNRIRVETRRLNDLIAEYNQEASAFPASLWTGSEQLPSHLEMPAP